MSTEREGVWRGAVQLKDELEEAQETFRQTRQESLRGPWSCLFSRCR